MLIGNYFKNLNSKYKNHFFSGLSFNSLTCKRNNILWFPRNGRLDPHPDYGFFAENCISDIKTAFRYKIPAIIDFHRVNIAGRYNANYRNQSLEELNKVLTYTRKHWPDTRFITTEELINICK